MGKKNKDGLTDQMVDFCKQYIVDFNGTQAAIRAGYSKKAARDIACENLTKPHIQQQIQKEIEARNKRTARSADEALDLVWKMAELDLANYMKVDDDGNVSAIPFSELPEGATRFINKIKQRKSSTKNKDGSREYEDVSIEYELPERTKCVDMLMKHYGLYTENHVWTGKDGKPIQVEEVGNVKRLTTDELTALVHRGIELGHFGAIKKVPGKG